MIVAAREFTSAAEMRAAAVAVHARCFQPRARGRLTPLVKDTSIVTALVIPPCETRPAWIVQETLFDAHVVQHQSRQIEIAMNPAKVHIKDRCREIGIRFEVIVGSDRRKKTAAIRHLLMWEVHDLFRLSFPAIGRLFGGRDHTTCLYAIRKIEAARGEA